MESTKLKDQILAAEERYYAGEHGRAKEALYAVLQNDPGQALANLTLGKILTSENQGQNALLFLQKALQQNENDAEAHATMGVALYQMGKYEQCVKAYNSALALDPSRHETRKQLGQVMSQFVPPWHFGMLSDLKRNEAYDRLLKKFVTPESVILDIGTGSGLLAMMAARHGAKHIYACEQSLYVSEVAKEIIAKNGFSDKITLFSNKSNHVLPHHLEERPNLIIGEIFDPAMVGEGAVPSFRDAFERLGAPGCRIIPNESTVIGKLIEIPGQTKIHPLMDISGFDLSLFNRFRALGDYATVRLPSYKHRFLSEDQNLLMYDFENLHEHREDADPIKKEVFFAVTVTGEAHGVAIWFDLFMDGELILSNNPERLDNHWGQAICFFREVIEVSPGDCIRATLCYTDMSIWLEDPSLLKKSCS
ncbi:MAG: tetratricopeptide repeat protein [Cyclobacteriaceae bacterium]